MIKVGVRHSVEPGFLERLEGVRRLNGSLARRGRVGVVKRVDYDKTKLLIKGNGLLIKSNLACDYGQA